MKDVYVVQYKETTLGEDNVMFVESGVCDFCYESEDSAFKQMIECVDKQIENCVDELGYDEDDVEVSGEDNDYRCINCGSNTYEYFVLKLGIVK